MAAVTLTKGTTTTETLPSTSGNRRRVVMPDVPHVAIQIYSASECYLERSSQTDDTAKGSDFETIPAGTLWTRYIGRGECAVSGSTGDQVVELTPVEGIGL